MKLAVASDHAGVALKARVLEVLLSEGHDAADLGTNTTDPVDYPDYAEAVALAVLDGQAELAVLICGSMTGLPCRITALRNGLGTSQNSAFPDGARWPASNNGAYA